MSIRVIPGRTAMAALGASATAALLALLIGLPVSSVSLWTLGALVTVAIVVVWDYAASLAAWRRSAPSMARRLPAAFAIGFKRPVTLTIETMGAATWHCELYDGADSSLSTEGLPLPLTLVGGTSVTAMYSVTPMQRGAVVFAPADVRVRSRWGFCELLQSVGTVETRRVYPDFAQVARYAWLAGDRRLQEIGVKTYQQRGQGTEFKQLSEYRLGDAVRHIDWRATSRMNKPIVREFQDERDQNVLLMLDCGRRMRADDRHGAAATAHFDQVLNAVMLLSYVALKQGDAVGAMTFGTPAGQGRTFVPRKGAQTLNAMMGQLYDVQPTPTHSDYLSAAQDLLQRQHKRALVVVVTNFRDEDVVELGQALRLLRSRHLVLLASLREEVVEQLQSQPLSEGDAAIGVASAHLYEQSRRDAFNRLSARDALMVDAAPQRLGIELVNRYHAVKRAGMM